MQNPVSFSPRFLWGTATSAYQIEGSPLADGAGASIWHRFAHTPGRTHNDETGDVACDHYRRFESDVALMADLGLNAYRFSVSWSRILPAGKGAVNPRGLAFYDRLTDALLARSIQPAVTLYHWDLPAALDDLGGWLNPDVADWFADYARVMFRALGDRVPLWTTLNEPWVVMDGGYLHGALAPGHKSLAESPQVGINLLRAHGAGVQVYRAEGKKQIGIVLNLEPKHAASDDPKDLAAVRRAEVRQNGSLYTETGWEVYPPGLTETLLWVRERTGDLPLYITENGAAFPDPATAVNGRVDDPLRVAYYRDHLRVALDAIAQGVNLRGYFAWSLLDNLEWVLGYAKRFGIVHVDYATQRRTPKASARFYSEVINQVTSGAH